MSIRNWLARKVNGLTTRGDLRPEAPRSPVLYRGEAGEWPAASRREARRGPADDLAVPHLGPYAPLIQSIRDELEHFVASYLRLHLAIAERDRYLLTSIDVHATSAEEDEELLRRFIREFRPEQIKHYLAKEVIAGLPNAGAIDLSQFAGLNAERGDGADDDDGYSELLAELRGADSAAGARPFEVHLIGRWSETGTALRGAGAAGLGTPLAGREVDIAIEDAEGSRHVRLPSLVPGRRYAIGKGEGCDIPVSGNYASRRHCEIWFDRGAWWLTDTGSTNGVRVERAGRVLGRSDSRAGANQEPVVVEVPAGARIVLSASADGRASDYPRLVVEATRDRSTTATPIAPAMPMPATPSTPVFARRTAQDLTIAVRMASGERRVDVPVAALPFSIGRSRNQALVIDRAHEGVSGHHLDVTAIGETGVSVEVHGDNGVAIAGVSYPAGARLTWRPGETMTLGRVIAREPECRLTLARAEGPWIS